MLILCVVRNGIGSTIVTNIDLTNNYDITVSDGNSDNNWRQALLGLMEAACPNLRDRT